MSKFSFLKTLALMFNGICVLNKKKGLTFLRMLVQYELIQYCIEERKCKLFVSVYNV